MKKLIAPMLLMTFCGVMPMHGMMESLERNSEVLKEHWKKNPATRAAVYGAGAVGSAVGAYKMLDSISLMSGINSDGGCRLKAYYSKREITQKGSIITALGASSLGLARASWRNAKQAVTETGAWKRSVLSDGEFRTHVGSAVKCAAGSAACTVIAAVSAYCFSQSFQGGYPELAYSESFDGKCLSRAEVGWMALSGPVGVGCAYNAYTLARAAQGAGRRVMWARADFISRRLSS